MTDRLLVYPLLIVTLLPLWVLLRHASRWLLMPILRHLIVLAVAVAALFTGRAWEAWGLFAVLILLPRILYGEAVRCLKAGQVTRATRWRRLARFGIAEPTDEASLPAELHGEIQLWELWTLIGTQQWERAVEWYANVETWGTFSAAMQARLAVARALAALGQMESAARSLAFVALSPRTLGTLAREYRQVRALVPADDLLRHAEEQTAEWRALMSWARPGRVTAALLVVLTAVWLVDLWSATPLFEAYGNLPWHALRGEWYRPVTALFLHAGWEHLGMNALALWMFGTAIENTWGGARMLICFLLAGTAANLLSAWVGGFDVSVGASGGVFGLVGAFGVAVYRLRGAVYAGTRRQMLLMLGLMCATDLLIGGLEPQIDNVAHIGGLITGVLLAYLVAPRTSAS